MDILSSMKIAGSALKAQRTRLDTIGTNIANIETTRTPEGGPFRKREVVFQSDGKGFAEHLGSSRRDGISGVRVAQIRANQSPPKMVYNPGHPDADAEGLVAMPNIDLMAEVADMMSATRAYEANVSVVRSAKRMALKALEIGQ
jgi:flagellar basal-body rod protein FlgC